jgi:protein YibB
MIEKNTTLVTALYDIGRGNWTPPFNRSHEKYFTYFSNILSLDSYIVIFIDKKDNDRILEIRKQHDPLLKKTHIINYSFEELEAYIRFFDKAKKVMCADFFKSNIEGKDTPEALFPEYNIINFNKVSFVSEAIHKNVFNTEYFMWIDAGFHHDGYPKRCLGLNYPSSSKIEQYVKNTVNFLLLEDNINLRSYFDARVPIAGSMFVGNKQALLELKELCFNVIDEFLINGAINDDQTIYAYAYQKNKNLFSFVRGNWWDNFYFFI